VAEVEADQTTKEAAWVTGTLTRVDGGFFRQMS
jgi:hypothetical protein